VTPASAWRMAEANAASTMAAPRQLQQAARNSVERTEVADGARRRAARRGLTAARATARRMAEVDGARKRAAQRQLMAARSSAVRMAEVADANGVRRMAARRELWRALDTASRMAEADAAKRKEAVSRQLMQAGRGSVSRTEEGDAARKRAARRGLKVEDTARRMEAADGASTWVAPRLLHQAARSIARHTAGASAAGETTASRWSLELQAARSAQSVCGTPRLSSTVCRRRHPQHPTTQSYCTALQRFGGSWTRTHRPGAHCRRAPGDEAV